MIFSFRVLQKFLL